MIMFAINAGVEAIKPLRKLAETGSLMKMSLTQIAEYDPGNTLGGREIMPKLKEQTRKNKAAYDVKYARENVTRKFIPFNRQNPQDQAMLDWLDEKENVTAYIKSLILGDMPEAGK